MHWLGSANIKKASKFAPFNQALTFAQSLGLAGQDEWRARSKQGRRPPNVPANPDRICEGGGWQGWGHWLGTGNQLTKDFLPFSEALALALDLGLAGRTEWRVWCKEGMRPPNVPANPDIVYDDDGWQGWGHWLGTGNQSNQAKEFLPFAEALAVAQTLGPAGMSGQREWRVWCREGMRPPNVPANPDVVYTDVGWQGWKHWLGTGNQSNQAKEFLPFAEALVVARSLGLASRFEWHVWCKEGGRPPSVPSCPDKTYKDKGWQGWGHWLGTGNTRSAPGCFLPFDEALAVAQRLGLASSIEWLRWCKEGRRPANVPSNPQPGPQGRRVAGVGPLAGHRPRRRQQEELPAFRRGAACGAATPPRQPDRVAGLVQEWRAPRQRARVPRQCLHARRVVRVGALAVPRQPRPSVGIRIGATHRETNGAMCCWHTKQATAALKHTSVASRHRTSRVPKHARCPRRHTQRFLDYNF